MRRIRLEDGTIEYNGDWVSVDDLKNMIQDKISAGDMKFADLADTLEALNTALEQSHTIETRLTISNSDYKKLTALCNSKDDNVCVRKAVMAFIGDGKPGDENNKKVIKCAECKATIVVPSNKRPIVLDCPNCGTSCRLTL